MVLSAGTVGCVTPAVEGFERGETTPPSTAGIEDERLPVTAGFGVCAADFEEAAEIAASGGFRASAGKVIELTTEGSSRSFTYNCPSVGRGTDRK